MLTQKMVLQGYITKEIFEDALAGPDFILALFRRSFIRSAERQGYVALLPPKIHFMTIDPHICSDADRVWATRGLMKVVAVGRAAKLTMLDKNFPQGEIHAC
jgi:hypothetical protein